METVSLETFRGTREGRSLTAWGAPPQYTDFGEPTPDDGMEVATVEASARTNRTRGLMSGNHHASKGIRLPAVAGVDGVAMARPT